ncbi:MAG: hypothetical protein AVDCRST_MAG76-1644, partial [uncultured Acidimicrobiales bacterium]
EAASPRLRGRLDPPGLRRRPRRGARLDSHRGVHRQRRDRHGQPAPPRPGRPGRRAVGHVRPRVDPPGAGRLSRGPGRGHVGQGPRRRPVPRRRGLCGRYHRRPRPPRRGAGRARGRRSRL